MSRQLNMYIQHLQKTKKKRRQLACVVTALSVFVSGSVFWQLRGVGTAMVDANLPNADDSGGEVPVTLLSSGLETPDVWEATLPPLTDSAGENLARIAESQLGYTESQVNFVHAEDGETHNGYTRYGAWYGNPYGEWNTMFTYFCMDYAGVKTDDIPYGSGCWAWSLELDKAGLITPINKGSPKRGDILLMDSDADGKADRSCIISAVTEDELPEITAIEGDIDGSVAESVYFPSDERLIGLITLDGIVPDPPVLPEEPAEVDFTAISESGIRVEAHADRNAFPPDTAMSVFDISRDEAIQTAAEQLGEDAENVDAVAVDITFTAPDGSELEPAEDSSVSVSITLPDEQSLSDGEFALLHISDDGGVQEVADASVSADGAEFVAEAFSIYVVTSNGTARDKTSLIMANGLRGSNSADNPYVIGVGEPIEVWYDGEDYADCNFTVANNDYSGNTIHRITRDTGFATWDSTRGVWTKIDNNMQKARFIGSTASQNSDESLYIVVKNGSTEVDRLYLKVVENPVYMYLDGERLILDTALTNLNKNSNKTIYMLEGESITFSVNGEGNGSNFSTSNASIVSMGTPVSLNGYTDVTFTAGSTHGNTTINTNGQTINIIVVHPMYIKDSTGERDIDRINEWLSMLSWEPKRNGYHPNSADYPYCLYDDDTLTLHVPKSDISNAKLEIGTPFRVYTEDEVKHTEDLDYSNSLEVVDGSLNQNGNDINVTLKAHNTTDYSEIFVPVSLKDGSNTVRTMYVKVMKKQNDLLDHADIEIADGGKYTVTKLKRNPGGTYTKTLTEYNAYVSGVNSSTLYSSEDNSTTCQFYRDNTVPLDSSVTGYRSDQYWVDSSIPKGSPQYELTSKYNLDTGYWSNTKFYPSDVDHVVFDVKLTLEPLTETTYTSTDGTTWAKGPTVSITDQADKELDSVPFNMNHQAVLDAYNKCPNHTGLDFTIMAFSALVEFDLTKELTGGNITAGQFNFGVYDSDGNLLSTATNDENRIVTFDNLHFEKAGTYNYTVKEIAGDDGNIIYDDSVIELNIEVTEDHDTNELIAEITSDITTFKFTNHHTFTLPSTGGTGELPYIIFGTGLISAALTLVILRRKKEEV